MPIGPFVPIAQMQCENAAVLDIYGFENVRLESERRGVSDQPCIAVNHHHSGVLGATHQHPKLTAGCSGSRSSTLGSFPCSMSSSKAGVSCNSARDTPDSVSATTRARPI